MQELCNVFYRTILVLIILFFIAKMLGKKQISQLGLFDYIVGITIGSIAADISLDIDKNLLSGILCLLVYGIISYLISIVTQKSIKARRFFTGVPTLLIEKGNIIESGLKKSKLDVNDLLAEARTNGYFNIDDINYAIMEINGSLSFLPKDKNKPVTKSQPVTKPITTTIPQAQNKITGDNLNKVVEALNTIIELLGSIDSSNTNIANKQQSATVVPINQTSPMIQGTSNNKQNILNTIVSGI